jgi:Flp pilus assembly protein TadD
MKQYAPAAEQYGVLALHRPGDIAVQHALGLCCEQTGNLDGAEKAFKAALSLDPKDAQAENNLGVIYERRGNNQAAYAAYKKAVAMDPKLTEARQNLARFAQ